MKKDFIENCELNFIMVNYPIFNKISISNSYLVSSLELKRNIMLTEVIFMKKKITTIT